MRDSRKTLASDRRGVSEVVGFILVFGFLILALTTYQATVVPQQNAQTEFQHFEEVRNEMIELRNAVSTAGQADVSQFPSVTLGTNYRPRLLTINPPDPAGTLKTSEQSYNITISNGTEKYDKNISTRFVEYRPGYNEISIGSTWLEHSVLYLDERDRGGVSIIQEQNIVKNGTVRITALQNQFQKTDTGRVTLELYPEEEVNRSSFPDGNGTDLNVTVPTRLDQSDYWGNASLSDGDIYQSVVENEYDEGIHALNLSVNETDLEVNTVGIRGAPDEGPGKNVDPQIQSSIGGNINTDIGFNSLEASSNKVSSQATEVVFTYSVTETPSSNQVEFIVSDSNGGSNSTTGPASTSETSVTVSNFVGGPGNNAPLTIEADISDGDCLSSQLGRDKTIDINDFNSCS